MRIQTFIGTILLTVSMYGCAINGRPTPEQVISHVFAPCPSNYPQVIQQQMSSSLFDPYSAVFRFSAPEKYVYNGQYGHFVVVGLNAKNRFGGYVGEHTHHFMCFPDGSIRQINELSNGFAAGLRDAGY